MYSIVFFKLLAELSLYFSFVVVVPELIHLTSAPYIAMILMALGQGVNFWFVEHNRRELRYLGLIFPILGLISSFSGLPSAFATIPAFIYSMYVIISYPRLPDAEELTVEYRYLITVIAIGFFVAVLGNYLATKSLTDVNSPVTHGANFIDARSMGIYALLFIVLMGLCVRLGRLGSDRSRGYNILQTLEYVMVIVPGLLLGLIISKNWKKVLLPPANAIKAYFVKIREANNAKTYSIFRENTIANNEYIWRKSAEFARNHRVPLVKPVTSKVKYDPLLPHLYPNDGMKQFTNKPLPKTDLFYLKFVRPEFVILFTGVAIIIILVLILNKERMKFLFSRIRKIRINSIQLVRAEKVSSVKHEKKKVDYKEWSDREKIRRVYREFLEVTRKRGIKITDKMTSEEVLNAIKGICDEQGAVALRNVYILARYNDYADINTEQVKAAKEALKQI